MLTEFILTWRRVREPEHCCVISSLCQKATEDAFPSPSRVAEPISVAMSILVANVSDRKPTGNAHEAIFAPYSVLHFAFFIKE